MPEVKPPTFVFVGHVNPGKSSVIATLLEDDSIEIDAMAGSTRVCQFFAMPRSDIRICDTPGFQNAKGALKRLEELRTRGAHSLAAFCALRDEIATQAGYEAESHILNPIIDGAAIVYVVDASLPLGSMDEAEIRILCMAPQPRMALINKTGDGAHLQKWQDKLTEHFSIVRFFDAHTAGFAQRITLLKTLAAMNQDWLPIMDQAVREIERDWQQRQDDCAETITDLLLRCLRHVKSVPVREGDNEKKLRARMKREFENEIREFEREALTRIVSRFRHHKVKVEISGEYFGDLFNERVWSVMGLSQKQLIAAGAVAGAAVGSALDLVFLGHLFGVPTVIGAAVGGLGALASGKHLADVKIGRLGSLGSQNLTGGPITELNFPWILLDRALITLFRVVNRAHARQDEATTDVCGLDPALADKLEHTRARTEKWSRKDRDKGAALFALISSGKAEASHRDELRALIRSHVEAIS